MSKKSAGRSGKGSRAGGEEWRNLAKVFDEREGLVVDREIAVSSREEAANYRDEAQQTVANELADVQERNANVQEANGHLVLATLAAEELKEAAQQTKRRQDEFLAMLAHELRNPLAPIRSAAALLTRMNVVDPTLTLIWEVIQRQVEHMARLLDDLLDASRVNSGKVTLQRRPTMVSEFVDQAVEICRGLIDAQNQLLTLDMPVTPIYVDGDPVRLAQVIGNLLHNAAKYTPENGAIAVVVRLVGDSVVIRVSDNGDGISASALLRIFDLFNQEDRSLNRSQGGLGIGLSVVRSMVELHGGKVEVHSGGVGQGSEFIVTLPRLEHFEGPRVAVQNDVEALPARILLIDDNVDAGVLLAMLLRMAKHQVEVALDGPQALEIFAKQQSQIVICDVDLPGMSGYEVAACVRERSADHSPVLIALTGYDGPDHRASALAAGFDHHVVKPVTFESLQRLIGTALKKLRSD